MLRSATQAGVKSVCKPGKKLHQLASVPAKDARTDHAYVLHHPPLESTKTTKERRTPLPYGPIPVKSTIIWGRFPVIDPNFQFGSAARRRARRPQRDGDKRRASPQQAGHPAPRVSCREPQAGTSIADQGCSHGRRVASSPLVPLYCSSRRMTRKENSERNKKVEVATRWGCGTLYLSAVGYFGNTKINLNIWTATYLLSVPERLY